MKITKKSNLSGTVRTMDINITQEQYDAWQDGELIQNVMPDISRDEREFIISGITPEEWTDAFGSFE